VDTTNTTTTLSYEDIPYEEQLERNLKERLGNTKVYLYEDVAKSNQVSTQLEDHPEEAEEELVTTDGRRLNALTLTGLPISCLKTQALFGYSSHFDATPTGLEWINDWTTVFVYPSTKAAKVALRNLRKFAAEDPDHDDFFTAKPIPVNLWPPGTRAQTGPGVEPGSEARDMKSRINIRTAKSSDTKEKGARTASEFYKKHGDNAGKEMYVNPALQTSFRGKRRRDDYGDEQSKRARLDAELDSMHSTADSSEAVEGNDPSTAISLRDRISGSSERRPNRRLRGLPSKKPTKQSLDDELDAFLNAKA